MKRIFTAFALIGAVFSANLWAHHMAAGIISDDLWDQIDLAIADTPHNEMLDAAGSTMEIEEVASSGSTMETEEDNSSVVYLVTNVPYVFDEDNEDFDTAESALEDLMTKYVVPATDEMNRMPTGTVIVNENEIGSRTTYVTYSVVYDRDGEFVSATVTTYEPIGRGEDGSQIVPGETSTAPGKRAGG